VTPSQARFLALTGSAMFLTQSVGLMLAPLLVDLSNEFDISVAAAGQLAAVTFAAWAISVISVGPISDSFGRRPVAVAGLGLLGISVLASSFAPQFWSLDCIESRNRINRWHDPSQQHGGGGRYFDSGEEG